MIRDEVVSEKEKECVIQLSGMGEIRKAFSLSFVRKLSISWHLNIQISSFSLVYIFLFQI